MNLPAPSSPCSRNLGQAMVGPRMPDSCNSWQPLRPAVYLSTLQHSDQRIKWEHAEWEARRHIAWSINVGAYGDVKDSTWRMRVCSLVRVGLIQC